MMRLLGLSFVLVPVLACGGKGGRGDNDGSGESGLEEGTLGSTVSASAEGTTASGPTGGMTDDATATGPKFDVGSDTEGDTEGGDCVCGSSLGFSYIWIANSPESTVSKLHTQTMVEEGRYLTRSDAIGDPSRTSVSLSGKAVAVANRSGGVVKIWARAEFCDEMKNGMPGVQTSMDGNDVLAWGEDDCVDWFTPFDYTTQRPIAWAAGALDPNTCEYQDETVWTAGCQSGVHTSIWAHRLDGVTGDILDTVEVVGLPCTGFGAYGGAADADGNFWLHYNGPADGSPMARVDAVTLDVTVVTAPVAGYGITVDHAGRPWLKTRPFGANSDTSSAARFDPQTQTWDLAGPEASIGWTGIAEDAQGRMWVAYQDYAGGWNNGGGDGITWIDVDTLTVAPPIPIPGATNIRGIAVDIDGNVWAVARDINTAFRYNPDTQQMDTYDQLNFPYTYSDMTGWALQNAACNPEG